MTETILLCHSGDKASWVWDYWYYYWKKYWTCSDTIDTIFLSENETRDYKGVKFYCTGNVKWGKGLIDFLSSIDCKYVIYIHEDYFLTEKTNNKKLYELIKIVKDNDMDLLKHASLWAGNPDWDKPGAFEEKFDMGEDIYLYSNDQPYLISHQTSIWDKDFLWHTILRPDLTPWEHEIEGTVALRERNVPIYAYRGKNPIEYCETVVHGKTREGQEEYFKVEL